MPTETKSSDQPKEQHRCEMRLGTMIDGSQIVKHSWSAEFDPNDDKSVAAMLKEYADMLDSEPVEDNREL